MCDDRERRKNGLERRTLILSAVKRGAAYKMNYKEG